MKHLILSIICVVCCSLGRAEGLRSGTIYIQPMIVEDADDNESVRARIRKDFVFMKRIYSQMGITVEDLPVKALGFPNSVKHPDEDGRLFNAEKLDALIVKPISLQASLHGVTAVPLFYVPSIIPASPSGKPKLGAALRGNTQSHGCFISLWMPPDSSGKSEIYPDTAAHEVLHLLLGASFSFGNDKYRYGDIGPFPVFPQLEHSRHLNDLMAPGAARNAPNDLKECAPLGRKDQIRNIQVLKNGQPKRLFDVVFENTKYVKVEHCRECSVSLDSGRILYQYPSWLPEPETLIKFYKESLSADGRLALKSGDGKSTKSKHKSALPIALRYTDLGQETLNSGGGVFGAKIQSKEPVVFNEPISELSASITIEDMTNFSDGQAEGIIVLNANISPSIFSRTHPLEKSAIDRTARALKNNGRHELTITFSDLRLALRETLKDFSIVATGRSVSEQSIECEVTPDLASGPDRMTIKIKVKQQVGKNKPDLGSLSFRIKSSFFIVDAAQGGNLLKGWKAR